MRTSAWLLSVMFLCLGCTVDIPPTELSGRMYTTPIDDGGVQFTYVFERARRHWRRDASVVDTYPDATFSDAAPVDAAADSGFADVGFPDSGPFDSGVVVDSGVVADSGVTPAPGNQLGFNMDFIYSGGEFAFANKMRQANGWISGSWDVWNDGRTIPVDENGWPTSLQAGQQAKALVPTHGLAETFVITWQGSGSVAVSDVSVLSTAQGRIEVAGAATTAGMIVRVTSLPVTSLQVRRASISSSAVWDPEFLQGLQGSRIVRGMQWGLANGDGAANNETSWNTRQSGNALFQRPKVGWEWHVDLANAVGADLWVCIPHQATDDYARQMGTLVAANLSSSLRVYVEYSNETWNGAYAQNAYTIQQGVAAGLNPDNQWYAGERWKARRSLQLWAAFEQGFGSNARVIRVLAGQGGWQSMYDQMFQQVAVDSGGSVPPGAVEAIAMAPYFGVVVRQNEAEVLRAGGVDWVFQRMEQQMTNAEDGLFVEMDRFAASARQYGVAAVSYEGGQHMVLDPSIAGDVQLNQILTNAQSDPRMRSAYQRVLARWQTNRGGVFVHYTYSGTWSRWGYWGACPRNDQCGIALKYQTLRAWAGF